MSDDGADPVMGVLYEDTEEPPQSIVKRTTATPKSVGQKLRAFEPPTVTSVTQAPAQKKGYMTSTVPIASEMPVTATRTFSNSSTVASKSTSIIQIPHISPIKSEAQRIALYARKTAANMLGEGLEDPLYWFPDPDITNMPSRFTTVWYPYLRAGLEARSSQDAEEIRKSVEDTFFVMDVLMMLIGVDPSDQIVEVEDENGEKHTETSSIQRFNPDVFMCLVANYPKYKQPVVKVKEDEFGVEVSREKTFSEEQNKAIIVLENAADRLGRTASDLLKSTTPEFEYLVALVQLAPTNTDELLTVWGYITRAAENPGTIPDIIEETILRFAIIAAIKHLRDTPEKAEATALVHVQDTGLIMLQSIINADLRNSAKNNASSDSLNTFKEWAYTNPEHSPLKESHLTAVVDFAVCIKAYLRAAQESSVDKVQLVVGVILGAFPNTTVYSYEGMIPAVRGDPEKPPAPPEALAGPSTAEIAQRRLFRSLAERRDAAIEDALQTYNAATVEDIMTETKLGFMQSLLPDQDIGVALRELGGLWPEGIYVSLVDASGMVVPVQAREDGGYLHGNPVNAEEFFLDTIERDALYELAVLSAVITARLIMLGTDPEYATGSIVFVGGFAVGLFFKTDAYEQNIRGVIGSAQLLGLNRETLCRIMKISEEDEGELPNYTEVLRQRAGQFMGIPNPIYMFGEKSIELKIDLDAMTKFVQGELFSDLLGEGGCLVNLRGNGNSLRIFNGAELLLLVPGGGFGGAVLVSEDFKKPDIIPAKAFLRVPASTYIVASMLKYTENSPGLLALLQNTYTAKIAVLSAELLMSSLPDGGNLDNIMAALLTISDQTRSIPKEKIVTAEDEKRWALIDAYMALHIPSSTFKNILDDILVYIRDESALGIGVRSLLMRFVNEHNKAMQGTEGAIWDTRPYREPDLQDAAIGTGLYGDPLNWAV